MMAELKSCPFCGGKPFVSARLPYFGEPATVAVVCEDCNASSKHKIKEEDAITAWNTRTPKENAVSDMARYIDADKLIAHLKDEIKECEIPSGSRANGKGIAYGTALGLKSAISFAETLSTADVVPKSEVAAEIIDDLAKQGLLNVEPWAIANLKKKYTETSSSDPKEAFIKMLADNWKWGEEE